MTQAGKSKMVLAAAAILAAAPISVRADQMMSEWDQMITKGVLISANTPPTSAHYMYVVMTGMYEAWAAYEPDSLGPVFGNRFDGSGGDSTEANKREAVSHAAYHALMKMTPSLEDDYRALMRALGYSPEDTSAPALLGKTLGSEIVEHHKNDGSNWENGYVDTSGYQPQDPSNPEAFQPLTINGVTQTPIAPHWRNIAPFAMKTAEQLRPPPPAPYGTPEWDAQVLEIIEMSANLTDYQKASLEWWLPPWGPPPPLHCEIDRDYAARNNTSFEQDIRMHFLSHNALYEASIVAWEAKYYYDYLRPITAIHNLGDLPIQAWGGPHEGTIEMKASEFIPYQVLDFVTPPFPEYVSGHSTFAGAWAEALTRFLGPELNHVAPVDYLIVEDKQLDPPINVVHNTWWDAAHESGIGRLWGGIHWHDGNENGKEAGRLAGILVHERTVGLLEGNDCPELSMRELSGPVGLTNLSLMQGTTVTNGQVEGFVGTDRKRNRTIVVGTETGGWDLTVSERGTVSGFVEVRVLDNNGDTIRTATLPIRGKTAYQAHGTLPGQVRLRSALALSGATGRGNDRVALQLKATDDSRGHAESPNDLVSIPANAGLSGVLAVAAGNLAAARERVMVRNVSPEMACLSAQELSRTRRSLWQGEAHLSTPQLAREGGTYSLQLGPAGQSSRVPRNGPAVARAQNGVVRGAASGKHEFRALEQLQESDLEAITVERLIMAAPGALVNLQIRQ